jgi:hypothetical protein
MQVALEPPPAWPDSFFAAVPGVVITFGPLVVPFVGNALSDGAWAGWVCEVSSELPPQPVAAARRRATRATSAVLVKRARTAPENTEVRRSRL